MRKNLVLLLFVAFFWACSDDDNTKPPIQDVLSKIETHWKFGADVEMKIITYGGYF